MHILVGYSYHRYTTGIYFEQNLSTQHRVTFVGMAGNERAAYSPDVDLLALAHRLTPSDLFVYIDSGHAHYLPRNLTALPCPTAAYLIDVHLRPQILIPLAAYFDYVFVAQRDYVARYRSHDSQHVSWLPLAYQPMLDVTSADDNSRSIDVAFVGNVNFHDDNPRAKLIRALSSRYQMNDYQKQYLPDEMAGLYRQAKIVFNHAIRDDVNMRVFEAMGNGALLVTNRIGNGLLNLFEDGKHLVTYNSEDELLSHIDYFLAHDQERQQIAAAGAEAIRAMHTYRHRVQQIMETIFQTDVGAQSPLRRATEAEIARRSIHLYSTARLLDATMTEWTHLRRLRAHRIAATGELIKAILRRVRYG
ncbi:glycosyltransferase [bacterium]|nr:glycosyltransferase [bacterium]